ncbi:MAG TPA: PAS domain-containing protein [Flavipsychrobacter sp.]|nr:PAS domain-containing protein [Flavipsychrobacter sp.]
MITEKDLKESNLRETQLISETMRMAGLGGWDWVPGTTDVYCTSETFALLKMKKPHSHSLPFNILFKSVPEPILASLKNPQKDNNSVGSFTYKWDVGDGTMALIECRYRQITDGNNIVRCIGTVQDISAFQNVFDGGEADISLAEDIARQNDMLRQAEETAMLGSWKYNFDSDQYYYSDTLLQMFGFTRSEIENSPDQLFERVIPEDVPAVLENYQNTVKDEKWRRVDFRIKDREGNIRYFTSSGRISKNKKGERIIIGTAQDITEQYNLSKKLEQQNDFVQKLVDSSVNGVLVLDKDLRFVLWNKRCEEIYGFSGQDIIGKTAEEVFGPMHWFHEAAEKALHGEKLKIENVLGEQSEQFYEINMLPLHDARGDVHNVFVLIHDITALKTLNDELLREKEFAEAVIEHSESCIFVFDKKLVIKAWNKKCEEFYGKSRQQVVGKSLADVFSDSEMMTAFDRLDLAFRGETRHYPIVPSKLADKFFDSYLVPMKNKKGDVINILCLLNDVTDVISTSQRVKEANRLLEQKKKELSERTTFLETLQDNSVDFICAFDTHYNIIAFNKICEEYYKLKKEAVLGRNFFEVFPETQNTIREDELRRALAGEVVHNKDNQSPVLGIYIENFVVPLKNNAGDIFGGLLIAHNITELKQTTRKLEEVNEQLKNKNHELNRINSELTSFSYVASHDLQEPLRKILAFSSLIVSKDLPNISETGRDYFKRIQSAAERMQQMIDGLLSFSRTNTAPKVFEERSMQELVKRAIGSLQEDIFSKRAIINTHCSYSISVIPHQFEQLLENVLSNAIKFQKEGNVPEVTVDCTLVSGKEIQGVVAERNKNYYRISVKDNGIGFAAEEAEKIFQMFHRLNGKSEYPGTGIGLAICRRIAQNHQGFITTESEPEKGATFNIFIPE